VTSGAIRRRFWCRRVAWTEALPADKGTASAVPGPVAQR